MLKWLRNALFGPSRSDVSALDADDLQGRVVEIWGRDDSGMPVRAGDALALGNKTYYLLADVLPEKGLVAGTFVQGGLCQLGNETVVCVLKRLEAMDESFAKVLLSYVRDPSVPVRSGEVLEAIVPLSDGRTVAAQAIYLDKDCYELYKVDASCGAAIFQAGDIVRGRQCPEGLVLYALVSPAERQDIVAVVDVWSESESVPAYTEAGAIPLGQMRYKIIATADWGPAPYEEWQFMPETIVRAELRHHTSGRIALVAVAALPSEQV